VACLSRLSTASGDHSGRGHVDYSFREFARCFLWQIVADASSDETVRVSSLELLCVSGWLGMRRSVRVTFQCNGRHANDRRPRKGVLKRVINILASGEA
jgi:hypothetical protein